MTATPLKFPRPLNEIIRDMERSCSPRQYDELLDEWAMHPSVVARRDEYDAADAVADKWGALLDEWDEIHARMAEHECRGVGPVCPDITFLRLTN